MLDVRVHDLRTFADDPHRQVDDRSFGGGPGMVMKPEPLVAAVESLGADRDARSCSRRRAGDSIRHSPESSPPKRRSSLICGRYEGIDERVVQALPAEELSIGDYVLSGGEVPALVVVEAVTRLVPGVIGNGESHEQDSFGRDGLLDHPHYTRPRVFRELEVPAVLLSGNHAAIAQWRRDAAIEKTRRNRPDLLRERAQLDPLVHSGTAVMNKTDLVEQSYLRSDIPEFRPGDTVKVHVRVVEGSRERVQVFQGVVIRRQNGGLRETFTVRKISFGVGVERTFPVHSPSIAKLEVVSRGKVRRAKLYYLRELRGKKARIKERRLDDTKLAALEAAALAAQQPDDEEADEPDDALIEMGPDDGSLEASDATEESPVAEPDAEDATSADEAEEKAEA